MNKCSSAAFALFAVLVGSGCASSTRVIPPTSAAQVGEFRHGFLNGWMCCNFGGG